MALQQPKDGNYSYKTFQVGDTERSTRSLLFATTNHIERLDPALSRPGRMDVWVNFKNATKWQAEGIFKNFFPCKSVAASEPTTPTTPLFSTPPTPTTPTTEELEIPKRRTHLIPMLEESELSELAKRFADAIPDDELSVSFVLPSVRSY